MIKKVKIIRRKRSTPPVRKPSDIELLFVKQYNEAIIEFNPFINQELSLEYRYNPNRRFRIDCAIVDLKIAIELEGGIWQKGGHSSGYGITRDCIKYNDLQRLGWKVFRFTSEQIRNKYAINWLVNYFVSQRDYYRLFISELDFMMEEMDKQMKYIILNDPILPSFCDIEEDSFGGLIIKPVDKKLP